MSELLTLALLMLGCLFFFAGTLGLLRFPDVFARLHALTKADNVGLLMICLALSIHEGSLQTAALLLIIWVLGLLAATVSCHLIARRARHDMESDS